MYRYTLKHPAGNLNHGSGAFSTIPSERASSRERSRPSPQASGTAIVEKTERQPKATSLPPLPPPERTAGARGRGGDTTSLDYRLTQGENKKTPFKKTWTGYVSSVNDTYHFRAVIAGHIIKLYKYSDLQVCQKGKSCENRKKREDRTEEEKQRDRKRISEGRGTRL